MQTAAVPDTNWVISRKKDNVVERGCLIKKNYETHKNVGG